MLNVNQTQWHYSENGHGKGAPDGIGGSVKRKADKSVAKSKDISCFKEFHGILREECKKLLIAISDEEIIKHDSLVPANLKAFKGRLRIRQIFWSRIFSLFVLNASESRTEQNEILDVYSSDDEVILVLQNFLRPKKILWWYNFPLKKGTKYFIGKVIDGQDNEETISFTEYFAMSTPSNEEYHLPVEDENIEPYRCSETFSIVPENDGNPILLSTFLNACRTARPMAIEEQKVLVVLHIKNKLRGRAAELVNSRNPKTWDEIRYLLNTYFGDLGDLTSLIADLQHLR
nr:unnamed protein product [Callosobruchus analis]